jgi:hypothetical protein
MEDDVRGTVHGSNGERVELRLGTQALGIRAKDLLPILLLLMLGVGGYLLYNNIHTGLLDVQAHQDTITTSLSDNRVKILEALHLWQEAMDAQTDLVRQMLQVHDYNAGRAPAERLPLEVPPSRLPATGTRGQ